MANVNITLIFAHSGGSEMTEIQPIQLDVAESVVVLSLSPGSRHRLFASAVDNVGNRQPMMMDDAITVDVPLFADLCPNNCSLRGNCSMFGICTCEEGYFGNACNLGNHYNGAHTML